MESDQRISQLESKVAAWENRVLGAKYVAIAAAALLGIGSVAAIPAYVGKLILEDPTLREIRTQKNAMDLMFKDAEAKSNAIRQIYESHKGALIPVSIGNRCYSSYATVESHTQAFAFTKNARGLNFFDDANVPYNDNGWGKKRGLVNPWVVLGVRGVNKDGEGETKFDANVLKTRSDSFDIQLSTWDKKVTEEGRGLYICVAWTAFELPDGAPSGGRR